MLFLKLFIHIELNMIAIIIMASNDIKAIDDDIMLSN